MWIGLTVVLALAGFIAIFVAFQTRNELQQSQQNEQTLSAQATSLSAQIANLEGQRATEEAMSSETPTAPGDAHIEVQHILIGFKDAIGFQGQAPEKASTRTQEQAKTLAYQLLDQIKNGANFDDLVKQNTDDQAPGIYDMANSGITPRSGEASRDGMVKAFGDIGFNLKVGEVGIADYDPQNSPFGYHIIKRLK